ncbi:response regulator transcription factor [Catenisphaera adipataccumulans]|uniref:DNA-binding response OmpR family regulator n=1 Tax=Catenisphaera adipataccumulans TaxID=700500 RepID=A0A7W8CWS8_9FIRM|nr:response regulator transcription factor [Catenisphaera adipataccumulans]MBB5183045.1 DNA-binding response OmpR family regulator [Catenisphaera adipataccumulans]
MKLLFAEDTQDLNHAVTTVLEYQGYDVTSVFDGQEALDALKKESYDVVVLDIMMPQVDGITVLKTMREHAILTPVLLLTAKSEVDDRVAGLDAGADDYLAKPFSMKELAARIRSMVRRSQYESETDLQKGNVTLHANDYSLSAANSVRLSHKEFELMRTLMMHEFMNTQYLLEQVWPDEPAQEDTVKLYLSYLKRKLASIGADIEIAAEGGRIFIREESDG